ncbi:MAG: hypothetical protein QM765_49605 [Myxococcales bacterium]
MTASIGGGGGAAAGVTWRAMGPAGAVTGGGGATGAGSGATGGGGIGVGIRPGNGVSCRASGTSTARRSASRISKAVWKRSSRRLASARRMTSS